MSFKSNIWKMYVFKVLISMHFFSTVLVPFFLDYAFDRLKIQKVGASADIRNKASAGLLKKLGFKQEGVFREHRLVDGRYYDELRFGLLKREYKK